MHAKLLGNLGNGKSQVQAVVGFPDRLHLSPTPNTKLVVSYSLVAEHSPGAKSENEGLGNLGLLEPGQVMILRVFLKIYLPTKRQSAIY